jgi:hypothetical protein
MNPSVPATLSGIGRQRKYSGAWPLASLRQSFLDGSLTRLVDPDTILRSKIAEFVSRGDFGLELGKKTDRTYERMWFQQIVAPDEVAFEAGVFLLRNVTAEALTRSVAPAPAPAPQPEPAPVSTPTPESNFTSVPEPAASNRKLRLVGTIPSELWNRLGTKILPKLRSGSELKIGLDFSVTVLADSTNGLATELRQILQELGLAAVVNVE